MPPISTIFRTAKVAPPTLSALKDLIRTGNFRSAIPTLRHVNFCKDDYNGLLHFAASIGEIDAVRYVLDKGVDVDQRYVAIADLLKIPGQGPTAAFIATMSRQHSVLELLLARGGNPNLSCAFSPGDLYHKSIVPLHQAAIQGDTKLGEILFKHKAQVNPRSDAGETPLLHACWKGHLSMMDLLLDNGADPTIPSTDGKMLTPLEFIEGNKLLKERYEIRLAESESLTQFKI